MTTPPTDRPAEQAVDHLAAIKLALKHERHKPSGIIQARIERHADALAARWCGWDTIGFCERDPWCQRVLAKNFPGVPIHDDIHTLTGNTVRGWGGCDVLTGGFPCQPYSTAGRKRGTSDDRALWPEMLRVITECRPRWVLGENVTGLIKMELDTVLADLEAEDYTGWPIVVPAIATDAPHKRDRVWIVAHAGSNRQQESNNKVGAVGSGGSTWLVTEGRHPRQPVGGTISEVADTDDAGAQGSCQWPTEPRVGRLAYGVPDVVDRLRGLGNAIVPQVAFEIMRLMS